jgi:hypothetical protein
MGKTRNLFKFRVRKSEYKGPLGRSGHRKEDNIKINIKIWNECELDLSRSGQVPVAGSCKSDNDTSGCIRKGKFID